MPYLKSIAVPPRANRISKIQRQRFRAMADDDGPTPFQLMRKAEQMGETVACDVDSRQVYISGSNTGQATATALTLLRFRERITWGQYRAGCTYAWLRFSLFGPALPSASTLFRVIHEHLSSDMAMAQHEEETSDEKAERMERMRTQYHRGDNRLRKLPYAMRVREMVRRVCIDDYYPDPARPRHLDRLREGLEELSDTWGLEDRR